MLQHLTVFNYQGSKLEKNKLDFYLFIYFLDFKQNITVFDVQVPTCLSLLSRNHSNDLVFKTKNFCKHNFFNM
jgi:hypothetical protein